MDYYKYQKSYLENFNVTISKILSSQNDEVETSLLNFEPFFAVQDYYQIKKNQSFDRNPIKINGEIYDVGYGVHANSCMKFDIKNIGFERFKGLAGKLDVDSVRQNFLEMRIYLDGNLSFTTGKLTTNDPPVEYDLDIQSVSVIELLVLDTGDNTMNDGAAWINPVLIK